MSPCGRYVRMGTEPNRHTLTYMELQQSAAAGLCNPTVVGLGSTEQQYGMCDCDYTIGTVFMSGCSADKNYCGAWLARDCAHIYLW